MTKTLKATDSPPKQELPNPFDLSQFRLPNDFLVNPPVKKVLSAVPVGKPSKQMFVRVHPEHRFQTYIYETEVDRETYLIAPALWGDEHLAKLRKPVLLVLAVDRDNNSRLWPLRIPGADGKRDNWMDSAMEAAKLAEASWIRIQGDMSLGAYSIFKATGELPEPVWPVEDFGKVVEVAFRGKIIDTHDHPMLKKLRGEA